MSKKMNTEFKFTDSTTTASTGTSTVESFTTYFCKYYLPCGMCDKTGKTCERAVPVITHPIYPNPWQWDGPYYKWWESPTCTETSTQYTFTTGTDNNGEHFMDNKTTMTKPE